MKPPLPRERERALLRAAKAGDLRALDRLAREYTPLCRWIASTYFYPGATFDDVVQEALVGVVKAVRSYDLASDVPFHRFAELCVRRAVITGLKFATRFKNGVLSDSVRVGTSDDGEPIEVADLLPSPYSVDPYRIFVAKEHIARLLEGISKLSPLERRALLGIAAGLEYQEIGQFKRVDNAVQRARRKLAAA